MRAIKLFLVFLLFCEASNSPANASDKATSTLNQGDKVATVLAQTHEAVMLRDGAVRVVLAPPAERAPLRTRLAAAAKSHAIELQLSGLSAHSQPGVTYHVYFGLAATAEPDAAHYVTTINFFNDVKLAEGRAKPDQVLAFDITTLARIAADADVKGDNLAVTLVPQGIPDPESVPLIGKIRLSCAKNKSSEKGYW